MSIVVSQVNTSSARTTAATLYNLLVSVGWISLGEGNGTTGGMGVTGIITTSARWFVLKHPTHDRNFLLYAGPNDFSWDAVMTLGYSYTSNAFSGGNATNPPTQLTGLSKVVIFNKIYTSISFSLFGVQNADPYGWYVIGINNSAPNWIPVFLLSCVPMDGYDQNDSDPYVFVAARIDDSSGDSYLFSYYRGGSVDHSGICLVPRSTNYTFVNAIRFVHNLGGMETTIFPRGAKIIDGYYQQIPSFWTSFGPNKNTSKANLYKGTSNFLKIITPNPPTTNKANTFNGLTEIAGYTISLPWDGYTVIT